MSDNAAFWEIVGTPADWRDLKVGEIFVLEQGPIRQTMIVAAMYEDSFDVQATNQPLPDRHKVIIIGGRDA